VRQPFFANLANHFMLKNILFRHKRMKNAKNIWWVDKKPLSLHRVFHGIRFKVSEDGRRETALFFYNSSISPYCMTRSQ